MCVCVRVCRSTLQDGVNVVIIHATVPQLKTCGLKNVFDKHFHHILFSAVKKKLFFFCLRESDEVD